MENETIWQCGSACSPEMLEVPPRDISSALSVLSGKWKILIIWQLVRRTCRFGELRRAIPGVTQHMLTTSLRELESEGIIARKIFAEVPPRVEYALTHHGRSLEPAMRALAAWGSKHLQARQA